MRICTRSAAYSLVEAMVALGVGTLVFGLIVATLITTQRAGDRLSRQQQVRQEALLISQSVERVLRYRVSPVELAAFSGGAGQDGAAGGGTAGSEAATQTLPASIAPLMKEATLEPAQDSSDAPATTSSRPARQPSPTTATANMESVDIRTSAPQSVRPLFTTGSATLPAEQDAPLVQEPKQNPRILGEERFSPNEVVVYSLTTGPDPTRIVTAIRNAPASGASGSTAYLEQSATGNSFSPGTKRRALGLNSDRFHSQVAFRFATEADGLKAKWHREAQALPQVIEYTVRVWPKLKGDPDFENARSPEGRPLGFQITSAVALK